MIRFQHSIYKAIFSARHSSLKVLQVLCILAWMLSGCKKDDTITVSGNNPPADNTVSEVSIENYINKTFITLLGREPQTIELKYYKQQFITNGFQQAQRTIFVNDVLGIADYRTHLYDLTHNDILQNIDSSDYSLYINIFQNLLNDTAYYAFWTVLQFEKDRLVALQQFTSPWMSGTKKISELHRLMVYNYFYDQINMGSLNFVNSVFQHFIKRNPTQYEQTSAVDMVDGKPAILMGKTGFSKQDFIDIIMTSNDYAEGTIRDIYNRFLFREPTNLELSTYTQQYHNNENYEDIVLAILVGNEFAGL